MGADGEHYCHECRNGVSNASEYSHSNAIYPNPSPFSDDLPCPSTNSPGKPVSRETKTMPPWYPLRESLLALRERVQLRVRVQRVQLCERRSAAM